MTAEVVVLGGRIYCDLVFSGLPSLPRLGAEIYARRLTVNVGGSANTAIALHRLGLRPHLLADLGTDFFSEYIRGMLAREGLDGKLIQTRSFPAAAVTVALPWDDERALVSYVEPEDLPRYPVEVLDDAAAHYVHICGMGTARHHAELVRAARAAGKTLLLDCACEEIDLRDPLVQDILRSVDYAMPNIAEALAMTGSRNIYKATKQLGELTPTVVVKMGADGSLAYSRGQWVDAPALAIEPVDTTGAGDCFAAGFILGLATGCSLEICLRYGNVAGGLSTLACGIAAAPTLQELQHRVSTGPWLTNAEHLTAACGGRTEP